MDEVYHAHQVRRLAGVTDRQLRYWDEIGLVRPSIQDTRDKAYPRGRPGRPRLYSPKDLDRIIIIARARKAGVSLQQVRQVLA